MYFKIIGNNFAGSMYYLLAMLDPGMCNSGLPSLSDGWPKFASCFLGKEKSSDSLHALFLEETVKLVASRSEGWTMKMMSADPLPICLFSNEILEIGWMVSSPEHYDPERESHYHADYGKNLWFFSISLKEAAGERLIRHINDINESDPKWSGPSNEDALGIHEILGESPVQA